MFWNVHKTLTKQIVLKYDEEEVYFENQLAIGPCEHGTTNIQYTAT